MIQNATAPKQSQTFMTFTVRSNELSNYPIASKGDQESYNIVLGYYSDVQASGQTKVSHSGVSGAIVLKNESIQMTCNADWQARDRLVVVFAAVDPKQATLAAIEETHSLSPNLPQDPDVAGNTLVFRDYTPHTTPATIGFKTASGAKGTCTLAPIDIDADLPPELADAGHEDPQAGEAGQQAGDAASGGTVDDTTGGIDDATTGGTVDDTPGGLGDATSGDRSDGADGDADSGGAEGDTDGGTSGGTSGDTAGTGGTGANPETTTQSNLNNITGTTSYFSCTIQNSEVAKYIWENITPGYKAFDKLEKSDSVALTKKNMDVIPGQDTANGQVRNYFFIRATYELTMKHERHNLLRDFKPESNALPKLYLDGDTKLFHFNKQESVVNGVVAFNPNSFLASHRSTNSGDDEISYNGLRTVEAKMELVCFADQSGNLPAGGSKMLINRMPSHRLKSRHDDVSALNLGAHAKVRIGEVSDCTDPSGQFLTMFDINVKTSIAADGSTTFEAFDVKYANQVLGEKVYSLTESFAPINDTGAGNILTRVLYEDTLSDQAPIDTNASCKILDHFIPSKTTGKPTFAEYEETIKTTTSIRKAGVTTKITTDSLYAVHKFDGFQADYDGPRHILKRNLRKLEVGEIDDGAVSQECSFEVTSNRAKSNGIYQETNSAYRPAGIALRSSATTGTRSTSLIQSVPSMTLNAKDASGGETFLSRQSIRSGARASKFFGIVRTSNQGTGRLEHTYRFDDQMGGLEEGTYLEVVPVLWAAESDPLGYFKKTDPAAGACLEKLGSPLLPSLVDESYYPPVPAAP